VKQHTKFGALAMIFVLSVLCLPSVGFAQEKADGLLKYAPSDTGIAFGFNAASARKTVFYKEALKILKMAPEFQEGLSEIDEKTGFDMEKDVSSLVFAMPTPKDAGTQNETFTLAISGKFNTKKITAELEKEGSKPRKVGKLDVYKSDDGKVEISFISEKLLIITSGSEKYRNKTFGLAGGKGKSAKSSKSFTKLIKRVDTKKHLWMVADTSKTTQPETGPQLLDSAVTIDFAKGMSLVGDMTMGSEDDIKKALAEFENQKGQMGPMVAMIGAPSLMTNMKVEGKGKMLKMSTNIPDAEVKAVAAFVTNAIKQQEAANKSAAPTK